MSCIEATKKHLNDLQRKLTKSFEEEGIEVRRVTLKLSLSTDLDAYDKVEVQVWMEGPKDLSTYCNEWVMHRLDFKEENNLDEDLKKIVKNVGPEVEKIKANIRKWRAIEDGG
jgi:hypothetical protein